MKGHLLIPVSLIFIISSVYSDEFKPSETLDYFCPCKLTASCKTVFGEGSVGHVYADILKVNIEYFLTLISFVCIPESFNTNISHQLFWLHNNLVNSLHFNTNSKGEF